MKMHEFIAANGDELVALMARYLKNHPHAPVEEGLLPQLRVYVDQVAGAMRKADGLTDASPLPEGSACAANLGHECYRQGYAIGQTAKTLSALSVAVGEFGGRLNLSFAADEYLHFNEAIDEGVAVAIEQYAKDERDDRRLVTNKQLGFVAHEFRNAAASANMAFQLIERGQVGIADRTADVIRRGFRRMESLAEKTLLLVGSDPDRTPSVDQPVAVGPLLVEIQESAVIERGITVWTRVDPGLTVLGDEQLLTSAIGNLVQNAVKFSRDGGEVRVCARGDDAAVLVDIEDECGGLPPGVAEELFEPFVQRSDDRRGAGLGLAIARQAIDQLSGTIIVTNLPPRGCRFTVRLARAPGVERPVPAEGSKP